MPGSATLCMPAATHTPQKSLVTTLLVLDRLAPEQKSSPRCSAVKTAYQKGATINIVYSLRPKRHRLARSKKGQAPECMRARSPPP
jgi:hypothetical protein